MLTQTRQFEKNDGKTGDRGNGRTSQDNSRNPGDTDKPLTDQSGDGQHSDQAGNRASGHPTGPRRGGYGEGGYLKDLERLSDDVLRGLVPPLDYDLKNGGFERSHLQPVAERLAKILDDLVKANPSKRGGNGVPDQYSHLVDEYFRALSEDFGSDARTSPESSPGRQ